MLCLNLIFNTSFFKFEVQKNVLLLMVLYFKYISEFIDGYYCTLIVIFILLNGCAIKPPHETGNFKPNDLVELVKLDTSIHLDIRYASSNNFAGRPVYKEAKAFLQRPAAEALIKISKELKYFNNRLLIFDGYRPLSVTKIFWNITFEENKKFVADPKKGSRHNRGCAIDLSLYELASGEVVQMTSEHHEMSERSYPTYTSETTEQRIKRDLLKTKMEANGFTLCACEWWHFDFNGWQKFRIANIPFSKIRKRETIGRRIKCF